MVGVTWKGSKSRTSVGEKAPSGIQSVRQEARRPSEPAISFRDKESYQQLFKPLPKPEPIPQLTPFKIEAKSWQQLQEEREALVSHEIERTRLEAQSMWDRAKNEDQKRLQGIEAERERMARECRAREEILRTENEERARKDEARRLEIQRQEELLAGRRMGRAKTTDPSVDRAFNPGNGIQIFHYKDPVVTEIMKQTRFEEMRRRASQPNFEDAPPNLAALRPPVSNGHPQHSFQGEVANGGGGGGGSSFISQVSQVKHVPATSRAGISNEPAAAASNLYRNVMEGKEFFKVGVEARSQSSSSSFTSTTSR